MKGLDKAVDRPLPVFLAAGICVLAGFWALSELPVNRAPQVEIPFSVVIVPYVGASPDDIETEVTIELEEHLNTLDNLRHIKSISAEGVSTHILEFEDRADMAESLRHVRDEVDTAEADFPDDVDPSIVEEISFDDLPIVFFTLRGGVDLYRLREIAEDLAPTLESVPGVSRVDVFGGLEREVHVLAEPEVLAGYGLTLADLGAAIGQQSHSRPAGQLRGERGEHLIRTTGEFASVEDIRNIAIAEESGGALHLRDVARVELSHVRRSSTARFDGEPSVTLIAKRQPDVNTLDTVERLKAVVEELRATLPPGVRIDASSDASEIIGKMIRQLGVSAAWGLALVVMVLVVVFGVRQALLVGSVLPFSLLFTFTGLWVTGMEVSNIALFALILVLGLVVDGAIIVGEAIHAEREGGASPKEAAKAGLDRVGLPVIAADLTTLAAFLPMLLMVGVMGQFMSVMPKVVCFALIGSVFVDHLLLPAATARFAPKEEKPRRFAGISTEFVEAKRRYYRLLSRALQHRSAILGVSATAFVLAALTFQLGLIDSIFLPKTDQDRFTVNYALPLGTPLTETERVGRLLMQHVAEIPELEHGVLTTGDTGALSSDGKEGGRYGPEYGRISVELVVARERDRSQTDIVRWLRGELAPYAGVEIDVDELSEGPSVGAALAIRVKGDALTDLITASDAVEQRLAALPGATDVRVDYDRSSPEVRVELDRPRAASQLGISPDQVSAALLTAFHGIEVGRMWVDDERVDIRLQAPEDVPHTPDRIQELPLRAKTGAIVPLGEVASVELAFGHNAIFRHGTERAITVRADALEGFSSVALETEARESLAELALPTGVHLEYGGEMEERDRSYASLWSALKWGLLLIYVVIAIQFNSLLQPFIVLLAVPLSVVGVTMGLLLTGTPFSFMVFIGIVSLTGIVVNDGIVMVDAINRKKRAGMLTDDAIRAASVERLRPVMLTTVTTIAGLLPLTLNVASGGEFWVPLGVAVISGLLVASMLTLFVVPVLYATLEALMRRTGLAPAPGSDRETLTSSGSGVEMPERQSA